MGTNKLTERNQQDTYEGARQGISYVTPRHSRILRYADLQSGHANSGSSESDLVSGKMKEDVVIDIIVIQTR